MSKAAISAARERRRSGLPLFRYGFRPFFFAAGLWAVIAMAIRLGDVSGSISSGFVFHDATRWHAHALLFGYSSAVVAGFALTAVPNWTGRLPISGTPLLLLFMLWLAGRAALFSPLPASIAIPIDAAFLPVLAIALGREIIAGRNVRNLPVCGLILLLGGANILFHLEAFDLIPAEGYGTRMGIGMLSLLIGLIGGRIIPSFTNNWFGRQKLPRAATSAVALERAAHAASALAVGGWVIAPDAGVTGIAFFVAAAAHALRLALWRGWRTWTEPLVFVLHVGYSWIPIGFVILACAISFDPVLNSAGLHALSAGAIGTMTLAVMTRATLGHTGRKLHANAGTVALFAAITTSAVLRVAAGVVPSINVPLLIGAGILWLTAFAAFVGIYGPMHLARRVGDAS